MKENSKKTALRVHDVSVQLKRRSGFLYRKSFSHWALRDASFTVEKGEIFGVIGRNGAGKSSLLRILARIIAPDDGHISTGGRKTCLLSLKTGFLSELTGRENAMLGGMLMGNGRKAMKCVIEDIKKFSELDKWFEQPISTYSSGMVARLGFSVAIYTSAEIILIDEVLGVGDLSFKEKTTEVMENFLRDKNRTVVLVSHSMEAMRRLCNRILWLEGGRVVMIDEPNTVIAAYQRFIKSYDIFHGNPDTQDKASALALAEALVAPVELPCAKEG